MSADELKSINDFLRSIQASSRPQSWVDKRAALEASLGVPKTPRV